MQKKTVRVPNVSAPKVVLTCHWEVHCTRQKSWWPVDDSASWTILDIEWNYNETCYIFTRFSSVENIRIYNFVLYARTLTRLGIVGTFAVISRRRWPTFGSVCFRETNKTYTTMNETINRSIKKKKKTRTQHRNGYGITSIMYGSRFRCVYIILSVYNNNTKYRDRL